jgi:tRNA threonylcarbamoyladenosine biosynthesis protein TsaB
MNLLAVDTSTTSCSVALFNDGRLLAEAIYTAGKTHSRHLMSIIDRLLDRCRCRPGDVDGVAVTRGPGTFTGLRIGISTVKGLAAATGAKVVGVDSLAALAWPLTVVDGPVVAMIDARRGEIYHASFNGRNGTLLPTSPTAVSSPDAAARKLPAGALLIGSGAVLYHDIFKQRCPSARIADASAHVIRAASVGMLAMERFDAQEVDDLDTLVPDYIRQSDAQIHMSASC